MRVSDTFAFGWAIADPWEATKSDGAWHVVDSGPICVGCGNAAPENDGKWPTLESFRDAAHHDADCPFLVEGP